MRRIGHKRVCVQVSMVDGWKVRLNVIIPSLPCRNVHCWNSYPNCSKQSISSTHNRVHLNPPIIMSNLKRFEQSILKNRSGFHAMVNHQKHRIGEIFIKRNMWLKLGTLFAKYVIFIQIRTDDANIYAFSWISSGQIYLMSHTYSESTRRVQIRAGEANIYLSCRIWLVRSGVLRRAPRKLWRVYSHPPFNCRHSLQIFELFPPYY